MEGSKLALAVLLSGTLAGCFAAQSGGPVDPRSNAIYDVARDSFARGQLREALGKVDEALDLDSGNADAAYLGSVVLLQFCAKDPDSSDCRFDEAEKYARRAIASNENMRDAKNTLGVILIHEKKYDDAIGVLKPLAEDILYGSPEKSWGNLGWAYLEKGQTNEAVDALRRSVAAQPNFCVGNFRLGVAYEKMGDLGAAQAALTRAVETKRPGCDRLQEAFDERARISLKAGKKEEARADFQKCRDIASGSPVGVKCEATMRSLE